jgi:hypothetical protein
MAEKASVTNKTDFLWVKWSGDKAPWTPADLDNGPIAHVAVKNSWRGVDNLANANSWNSLA